MRILLLDIDSLRPDHMGCYGYVRATTPNIDRLAQDGFRFNNCFVSDSPCMPSRFGLATGISGTRSGVVGHYGEPSNLQVSMKELSFVRRLHASGVQTTTISSFADRHSAWAFLAGWREALTHTLKGGFENADEVNAAALPWLMANAASDNWLLHVQYWDPHAPYSSPSDWAQKFNEEPLPECPTLEEFTAHRSLGTPHSPSFLHYADVDSYDPERSPIAVPLHWGGVGYERPSRNIPKPRLESFDDFRSWIGAYDGGIAYADHHVGQLLDTLETANVLDQTMIVVTADHGELQGEFGVYGEHNSVYDAAQRVPLIFRFPGMVPPGQSEALVSNLDLAPTFAALFGADPHPSWDGRPLQDLWSNRDAEWREFQVLTHGVWSAQRGVRTNEWAFVKTYHPGHYLQFEPVALFNVQDDPHQRSNVADVHPQVVMEMEEHLAGWSKAVSETNPRSMKDPLEQVVEHGPFAVEAGHWIRILEKNGFEEYARRHKELAASSASSTEL